MDLTQFTKDLTAKLRRLGCVSSLSSRSDISQQVLCDNFELVLRVITQVLLQPRSLSLVDWGLTVYATVGEVAMNPDLTDSMLQVYRCLVTALTANTQDASIADALATVLPTFLQKPSHVTATVLPSLLNTLVSLSPDIFSKWLVPHLTTVMKDIQRPDLEQQLLMLQELYRNHSEMVTSLLQQLLSSTLQDVSSQSDCMIYRHVIALLNAVMRIYP